ncbi:unnamed protein product [Trichobilharzia szidati]|nr:unnamed protein product [Trichobilharzia szidati]
MWKKCCIISCVKCSQHQENDYRQKNLTKLKTSGNSTTNSDVMPPLLLVNSTDLKPIENNHSMNSKCDPQEKNNANTNIVVAAEKEKLSTSPADVSTTLNTNELNSIKPEIRVESNNSVVQISGSTTDSINPTTTTSNTNINVIPGDSPMSTSSTSVSLTDTTNSAIIKRPLKPVDSFVHRREREEEGVRPFNQLFRRSISNAHFTSINHSHHHNQHYHQQQAQQNSNSNNNNVNNSNNQTIPTFFLPRTTTSDSTTTLSLTLSPNNTPTMYDSTGLQPGTKKPPIRRGSMIVRLGRSSTGGTGGITGGCGGGGGGGGGGGSLSSTNGLAGILTDPTNNLPGSAVEGVIVTPFAQVLVSMQRIRSAFIRLTAAQVTNRYNISTVFDSGSTEILTPDSAEYKAIANETLEELEWCLKQLENIQTKRPVSDMAFSKFKRLLNKELSSFGEADKSRHQISAYICETFLETEKDAEANEEIESMLERRRSSGQSHCSNSGQDSGNGNKRHSSIASDVNASISSAKSPDSSSKGKLESPGSASAESHKVTQPSDTNTSAARQSMTNSSKGTNVDEKSGTDNASTLPIHGVETPNDKELEERFTQSLDEWGLDIFEIDRLSNGHALTTVAYRIFQKRDLLRTFCIDPSVFVRYMLKVESTYHADVPYHNSMHAADVLQTSHYLLQAETLDDVFSDLEILAVLFASAIHDVDHPGVTNQFLVNTGHELALQYNDSSVLENHHLYMAFKILSEPECDIFANLGVKKRQTLRRMVIELVLATDMSKHMSLLADLRTMVETKKVSGSGILNLDNYADRVQILQNMIHCADLSNPAKPLRLYRKWTGRLIEEFFRQGDKERKLSLEISPMCDRESVAIEKSQVSFIDFVCHPLWETWCDLVHPCAQLVLDTLEDNRDWYECQAEDPKSKGAQSARPKLATAAEDDEEVSITSGNAQEQ